MKRTLLMLDETLQMLKESSLASLDKGYGFLKVSKSLGQISPYVDNAILYCNSYMNTNFPNNKEQSRDIMIQAESCRQKIDMLHQALETNNKQVSEKLDFYSKEGLNYIEDYLDSITKKPAKEAVLEQYFLKGALEAALATTQNRQRSTELTMVDSIQNSEIAQHFSSSLAKEGVILDEDDELDIIDEAIVEGCSNLFFSHEPLTPKFIHETILSSLGHSVPIQKEVLSKALSEQGKSLLDIVKKARNSMHKHKNAARHLNLFVLGIDTISHEDVERQIYLNQLPEKIHCSETLWDSAHFPKYLLSYKDSEDLQDVMREMKNWENFDKEADAFDKEKVYPLVGRMGVRWLACLNTDLALYEEKLDEIDDFEDPDDEEDDDYHHEVDKELEDDILAYAKELVISAEYVEKYIGIDVNQTGVTEAAIETLMQKDHLESQDVDLLGELFYSIGQEIDNYDGLRQWEEVDYDEALDAVLEMPHGCERKEALTCLRGMFDVSNSKFDDELSEVMADLDKELNNYYPDLNQALDDFVKTGTNMYPELIEDGAENITDQIKLGVLSVYIVPLYLSEKTGTQQQIISFIENYEAYSPQAQEFLKGITKYYGDKVLAFHQYHYKTAEKSPELQRCLEDYDGITSAMNYVDNTIDLIDSCLDEEQMLEDYRHQYQEKKAKFEMPKDFDLQIAVQFYKGQKGR